MGDLLETCLLEGIQVFYNFGNKSSKHSSYLVGNFTFTYAGMNLEALTEGIGVLCSCSLYEGSKIMIIGTPLISKCLITRRVEDRGQREVGAILWVVYYLSKTLYTWCNFSGERIDVGVKVKIGQGCLKG
ncbi:hypothetical protein OSB04_010076 [Centaurea solstitialis]|uniref:Uncharacterized protein n=1 Tax=Centaurea solstitialis TaxID=347529 RepID=A0AA38TPY0_9ASTR|nr:hypothetical protein OSB04_010076 [Centaurea solstitialis]